MKKQNYATYDKFESEDFLKYCLENVNLKRIIGQRNIKLSKQLLENNGIKPKEDGLYRPEQRADLYNKLSSNGIALYDLDADEKANNIYEFFNGVKDIDLGGSPELKRFLLLTLSEEFNNKIISVRKIFDIPEDGFKSKIECGQWLKKTQESSSPKTEILSNARGLSFKLDCSLVNNIKIELAKIFDPYKVSRSFWFQELKNIYLFYAFNDPTASGLIESFKLQSWETLTVYTPKYTLSLCGGNWGGAQMPPHYKNNCFFIHMEFPNVMRKKDIENFIEKRLKSVKEEFYEYINIKEKNTNKSKFLIHWLIYFLHEKLKYKLVDVKKWINKKTGKLATNVGIYKDIQRFKKQIDDIKVDN
jgi:hypothetical protein